MGPVNVPLDLVNVAPPKVERDHTPVTGDPLSDTAMLVPSPIQLAEKVNCSAVEVATTPETLGATPAPDVPIRNVIFSTRPPAVLNATRGLAAKLDGLDGTEKTVW